MRETINETYSKLNVAQKKTQRERADLRVVMNKLTAMADELKANSAEITEKINVNDKRLKNIVEAEEIQIALELQDEADKVKVALYGIPEEAESNPRESSKEET